MLTLNEKCITYILGITRYKVSISQCSWSMLSYIMILGFYSLFNVIHRLKWTLFLLDRIITIYSTSVPKRNIITLCFTSTELDHSQYATSELFGETEVNNRINNTMEKPKNCRYFASCPLPPFTVFCHCWRVAIHWLKSVHNEGNAVGCPADKENQHEGCNDSCALALLLLLALWIVL